MTVILWVPRGDHNGGAGRDLFRFPPADIPYCGETCPGVDRCDEPDHGGAVQ